jgi:hypothetical protein
MHGKLQHRISPSVISGVSKRQWAADEDG